MATKKKLLQAAAGTAAASGGAGGLNVEDVFSTYLYEGNGSAQVIENGIELGQSGSVQFENGGSDRLSVPSSSDFALGTNDFTIEMWIKGGPQTSPYARAFVIGPTYNANSIGMIFDDPDHDQKISFYAYNVSTSRLLISTSNLDDNKWRHVAITRSSGTFRLFVNGVLEATNSSFTSSDALSTAQGLTIGHGPTTISGESFAGYISNFHVINGTALYTSNFSVPAGKITTHANTVLLTAQDATTITDASTNNFTLTASGTTQAVSGGPAGEAGGEGGLVWIKDRLTTRDHMLNDTERGADKSLSTNRTGTAFLNYGAVTSFNSNGFSIGAESAVNASGTDLTSWTFRKAPKFFDVVEFTAGASGTDSIINHNLGCDVGFVITKAVSTGSQWYCFHRDFDLANGEFIQLNSTAGSSSYDSVSFTSTQVNLGQFWTVNNSGETIIAYLFAHNDGDGEFGPDGDADIIKCGSYTGTGSAGNFIDLGFEPQWLLVKATNSNQNWEVFDNMRGTPTGGNSAELFPNTSSAERSAFEIFNFTPTGFETVTTLDETNTSGYNYIYIAIRRGTKVPESATDVFDVETYTGNATANRKFTTGFAIDTNLILERDGGLGGMGSRLIDGMHMTSSTDVSYDSLTDWIDYDYNDGFELPQTYGQSNYNGESYVTYSWQRRPNFFDVVAYTGTGSARTVSHNLGVAPEMIWVKCRSSANTPWLVYHKDLDASNPSHYYLYLNSTAGASTFDDYWNQTEPTSSVFSTKDDYQNHNNNASHTYIAYLFASVDGVSKVGSFTAGSSDTFVDCGFSSSARFVLMKRSSGTGDWFVYDSERGYAAGFNDKRLKLNTTGAETTNNNIDPTAGGFTATGNTIDAGTYIFYAIA